MGEALPTPWAFWHASELLEEIEEFWDLLPRWWAQGTMQSRTNTGKSVKKELVIESPQQYKDAAAADTEVEAESPAPEPVRTGGGVCI